MAQMTDVPFAVQKGNAGVTQNSDEKLLNMFAEIVVSGRSPIVRRQRPCLRSVYAVAGEKRCIERHKSLHYLVISTTFYSFDGITLMGLGSLNTSTGRCSMIFNDNDEVMISDGTFGYFWNGVTLALVTTPVTMNVGTLAYIGGFGLANDVGTGQFYSTVANDFSDFDGLDFATAESNPDPLVRVFADHSELWLAGERSIEVWQLSGSVDFPFAPASVKIERGTAAKFSLASEANTVLFLGDDLIVYRADGYRPNRASTHAIEHAIKQVSATGISSAYAMLYSLDGHKFYALTFPGELTIVLDLTTSLWAEANTYESDSWDVMGSNGKNTDYVLTAAGICELTGDVNKDEGGTVVRLARSAPGAASGRNITMHEFFADCEVGRAGPGVSPDIMLRVALDGETFGNIRTVSLGTQGNYQTRPVWGGLGQGRKPVLEISASGDFNFAIMGTLLNATVDNS